MFENSPASRYGVHDLPFRSRRQHARCLDGRHDLQIAEQNSGWNPGTDLTSVTCLDCVHAGKLRPQWFVLDHRPRDWASAAARMHTNDHVQLIPRRPAEPGGLGRIDLQADGELWGYVALQLCGVDRRAVLARVAVRESQRRRGLGTLLLDAALASAPGYDWSTEVFNADDPVLRSFRATLDLEQPVTLGMPHYCSHMRRANGDHDWL